MDKLLVVDKLDLPLKGGEIVGYLEIDANLKHRIPVAVAGPEKREYRRLYYKILRQSFLNNG